jgi:DNA-binding transcriptional regulator LsrR (DeoR family)
VEADTRDYNKRQVRSMAKEIDRAELLAQVAHLYFDKNLDQTAIAKRLGVSRSSISRLLALAREQGIVEIIIHYPLLTSLDLEARMRERFGLKEVCILNTGELDHSDRLNRVSLLAGRYLENILEDGQILAVSWGSTLLELAQNFHPTKRLNNLEIVQLVGAVGSSQIEIDATNLVRLFAGAVGGRYYNLNAPMMVETMETQKALLQEPSIIETLDRARRASVALVGIGEIERALSTVHRSHILDAASIQVLHEQNAVGGICSQYYDIQGRPISDQVNSRVVGLDLPSLKQIPRVIGIAIGEYKARAIFGALRGQFVNVLVTDDLTAESVLRLADQL